MLHRVRALLAGARELLRARRTRLPAAASARARAAALGALDDEVARGPGPCFVYVAAVSSHAPWGPPPPRVTDWRTLGSSAGTPPSLGQRLRRHLTAEGAPGTVIPPVLDEGFPRAATLPREARAAQAAGAPR